MPVSKALTSPEQTLARTNIRKAIGTQIVRLRQREGLTQEALALAAGWSRNQLIFVEHGERGIQIERLYELAEALGVTVHDLLPVNLGEALPEG
ncbi:hypothetical protein B7R54_01750 [Subtercola boreus]|uniref:HTH cro/C1-type domain-containing protein n=2 Tax=Subtercola boreus TaxID=120213 RepID=A0A3E0VM43_9MICO|nr:hypothetical protein B7R54_01750 [Subtercola boreus]